MNASPDPIDLDFRPASYFWPLGLETHLLSRIKGEERKTALQALIDSGRVEEIPDFFGKSALTEAERRAIGRIHPMFMGGEYLPDMGNQEVEIVRMAINSTTFDVTSVYARRGKSRIYYRVVDEYGGDTLSGPSTRSSIKPLNLGQLVEFFDRAWPLMEVLEMNFEGDIDGMLGFFRAESVFYPQTDALYRIRVKETVTLSEQAMTEYLGK